jgi:hypothetical protein
LPKPTASTLKTYGAPSRRWGIAPRC